jgi:hypothetical protein
VTANSARTRAVRRLHVEWRDRVESSGIPEHGLGAVSELRVGGCTVIRGLVRAVAGKPRRDKAPRTERARDSRACAARGRYGTRRRTPAANAYATPASRVTTVRANGWFKLHARPAERRRRLFVRAVLLRRWNRC